MYLDGEKKVLGDLERQYKRALEAIDEKIAALLGRGDADMQHVIYRVEHQKALRIQVQAILEQLQANEFETISEYLTNSYNDGFVAAMYSMHQQDQPFVVPIDQKQVVQAIQHDTKLSEDLYTSLGEDVQRLKKVISAEISRGIASGLGYGEIARNIGNLSKAPLSRAKTIARTEAGRIQEQATIDAAAKSKAKGARIVKMWDAVRDGSTRSAHRQLHGQVREIEEPYEYGTKKAMHPHGFGDPALDINCRCTSVIMSKKLLDKTMLEELQENAKAWGLDTTDSIEEFKKRYMKAAETVEKSGKSGIMESWNMSNVSTGGKRNEEPLSEKQIDEAKAAAYKQGYKGDIMYSLYSNTSFHGSREGEKFHYLIVGTDAYPSATNGGTANERISLNACMAHEIVGHYEAWVRGTTQANVVLEEAQASIRASRFGVGLTVEERKTLYEDALDRLKNAGIDLRDVEDELDIWER